MLKKLLSYFFIVFGLVVLWASTSRRAMEYISEHRDSQAWWGAYPCIHGDLISMSYLDMVGRFNPPPATLYLRRAPRREPANTDLYLHGDSYSYHLADSVFSGLHQLYLIDRNHGMNYHLDSTKRNIMVIEISERYLWPYFSGLQMLDEVCDSLIKKKSIAFMGLRQHSSLASFFPALNFHELFNKYINQNLQCNLFNYNLLMPMFESKAALNYYIFNRASGDVVISADRNFLFLRETVSLTDAGSSYVEVTDAEVKKLVSNFNTIYKHYKDNGFDEVYLSVIPNSATIMQPQGYNRLIPRLQQDPDLHMKIIDAFTRFGQSPDILYQPGDTHWNLAGKQLWIDLVNETLELTSTDTAIENQGPRKNML